MSNKIALFLRPSERERIEDYLNRVWSGNHAVGVELVEYVNATLLERFNGWQSFALESAREQAAHIVSGPVDLDKPIGAFGDSALSAPHAIAFRTDLPPSETARVLAAAALKFCAIAEKGKASYDASMMGTIGPSPRSVTPASDGSKRAYQPPSVVEIAKAYHARFPDEAPTSSSFAFGVDWKEDEAAVPGPVGLPYDSNDPNFVDQASGRIYEPATEPGTYGRNVDTIAPDPDSIAGIYVRIHDVAADVVNAANDELATPATSSDEEEGYVPSPPNYGYGDARVYFGYGRTIDSIGGCAGSVLWLMDRLDERMPKPDSPAT